LRHTRRTRCSLALAALALCAGAGAQGLPARDGAPPPAEAILGAAFANRYEVDLTSNIDLVMRNRMGQELRRRFRAASKVIDGRVHSVGRLVWPEYLRGMTILTIEAENRSHDSFLYLPSLGKVRRVTTAQRHDSFLGSDVTYEDLERRRVADYELGAPEIREWDGEPVYVIRGSSRRDFDYSHLVFVVARSDGAILETQYFKRGQEEPYRVIRAPREAMVESDGHVIPTRLDVENRDDAGPVSRPRDQPPDRRSRLLGVHPGAAAQASRRDAGAHGERAGGVGRAGLRGWRLLAGRRIAVRDALREGDQLAVEELGLV